jgi:hypothetical protein
MWKVDCKKFFYVFRLSAAVRALCCTRVRYRGVISFWQALASVMGVRPSPGVASCASGLVTSTALAEHHERLASVRPLLLADAPLVAVPDATADDDTASAYVDDCAGAGVGLERAGALFNTVRSCLDTARVTAASGAGKVIAPTAAAPLLGRHVNLANGSVSLPDTKAATYMVQAAVLRLALGDGRLRGGVAQSLCRSVAGRLGWWANLQPRGAAHLSRLGAAANLGAPPSVMAAALVPELEWWRDALLAGELEPLALLTYAPGRTVTLLASDAGDDTIAGEIFGPHGWRAVWRRLTAAESAPSTSSTLREALAAAATARLAASTLPRADGSVWLHHTDNDGLYRALNRWGSVGGNGDVNLAVDIVYDAASATGATVMAVHDPRESPCVAVPDLLTSSPSLAHARSAYRRLRGADAELVEG